MADYATLLRDHVTLTCRSVDRIFLQAYVPKLQSVGGVCQFLYWQKGFAIPSSAAFGKIGDAYVAEVHRWAKANAIPVRRFAKGENKEQIARPLIEAAEREGGDGRVVLIGIAQEKAPVWRSWKAKGQEHAAHPHMEWGRQMAFVNHFYFYLWDPEWGGAFWKTNAYAPWPIWIWLNGHTGRKRQCDKAGIGYTALDNGFRDCEDPAALQRICDRLGSGAVKSFFWRWHTRLPSPLTRADLRAGYVYELAFRQFEISDTRVFDRPAAGRSFFEQLIRDHLDVGRPESVSLIFDRRINRTDPGHVPHQGHHPRGRSADQLLLQVQPDQAIFQGASGAAHRDGDLQHPRLRHRPAGHRRELASPSGGWRCTPTSVCATPKPPMPDPLRTWPPSPR